MAQVRNSSGEDRTVPSLGGRLVLAGQVVDVPDGEVYAYTQQSTVWSPADPAAQAAHDADAAVYGEVATLEGEEAQPPAAPAANASRDDWAAYVLATARATAEQIDGLGRDAIRDTYGPTADQGVS